MLIEILLFIIGTAILLGGSNILVGGSAKIARSIGISPLLVGLTLVAFGTSFPELAVSFLAAFKGNFEITVGNIVGSNIANIGLIIGLSALFFTLKVEKSTLFMESPFMIFSVFLLFVFSYFAFGPGISRMEGIILLVFFVMFIGYTAYMVKSQRTDTKLYKIYEEEYKERRKIWKPSVMVLLGFVGVIGGAKFMVDSAIVIAGELGIPEAIIALSIIAIGTSLPELVTSLMAVYKKEPAIAVGNIVGSSIFNTLLIIGASATVFPLKASLSLIPDMIIMLFFSVIFLVLAFTKRELSRAEGGALLLSYMIYLGYLYTVSSGLLV